MGILFKKSVSRGSRGFLFLPCLLTPSLPPHSLFFISFPAQGLFSPAFFCLFVSSYFFLLPLFLLHAPLSIDLDQDFPSSISLRTTTTTTTTNHNQQYQLQQPSTRTPTMDPEDSPVSIPNSKEKKIKQQYPPRCILKETKGQNEN